MRIPSSLGPLAPHVSTDPRIGRQVNWVISMGAFILLYLAVAGLLGISSLYYSLRLFLAFRRNSRWSGYAFGLLATTLPFLLITWPFTLGRLIFEANCALDAGLYVRNTASGRNAGYFLHDPPNFDRTIQVHPYARQAVYDLLSGRIAFFEVTDSITYDPTVAGRELKPIYRKVFLADSSNPSCNEPWPIPVGLSLPAGKCLVSNQTRNLESKFEIRGYRSMENGHLISVSMTYRDSGKTWASYKSYRLNVPLLGHLVCPEMADAFASPLNAISTVALEDERGGVLTMHDFGEINLLAKQRGLSYPKEIPPFELRSELSFATNGK
jgi:hypothetical protein